METETPHRGPGRPPLRKDPDIVRPEMHAEDPREAAKRREQEILGTGNLDNIDEPDEYWIDPKFIPDGWSWEWKRYSVLNEIQQSHINSLKRTGWEFVPPDKYPIIPGVNGMIVHRGNALMERPASITAMMMDRDRRMAKLVMDNKAAQIEGKALEKIGSDYSLTNRGDKIGSVKKSYSPMAVPNA